jgi:tRNA pseudouridine55 synthase
MTSRKVVDLMMYCGNYRGKVGHAGTLDPIATGLLILCFGKATRLAQYLIEEDKKYTTTFLLGEETTTGDKEGEVIFTAQGSAVEELTVDEIRQCLRSFTGRIEQVPPSFSARKVNGKRSYELARKGIDVDLEANTVEVHRMDLVSWEPPLLTLSIQCSTGTYVRALARDIGRELGVGAHVTVLKRNSVGPLDVDEALPLDQVAKKAKEEGIDGLLLPVELPLRGWTRVRVDDALRHRLVNGARVVVGDDFVDHGEKGAPEFPRRVGIWSVNDQFIGVGRIEPAGAKSFLLYPEKVILPLGTAG